MYLGLLERADKADNIRNLLKHSGFWILWIFFFDSTSSYIPAHLPFHPASAFLIFLLAAL